MNRLAWSVGAVLVVLALWGGATYTGAVSGLFLPTPGEVASTLYVQLGVTGELWGDIYATLTRTLLGFLIGGVVGVALGIALGMSEKVYAALDFLVDFFRSVPATALFPLFLLFFGIGDEAKVAVAVWVSLLVVLVNTSYGVRHASKVRLMAARAFRPSRWKLFREVVLFEAAPHIASALRIALSLSLIVVVVTEMFIGTNVGLGHRIIDAQLVYRIPEMYAAILAAGVLGYLLNQVFLYGERRLIHWAGR